MRLKQFKQEMIKDIFTKEEAQLVAFDTPPNTLKLQLHQWVKAGDIMAIKRGVYSFSGSRIDKVEVAPYLYHPCYISLESALNVYGFIPDVPFALTLVTPKATRKFNTPYGQFIYHKIKQEAFFGYDGETLMAEREKAFVDYLYLNSRHILPNRVFWEGLRLENITEVDFTKAFTFAEKFHSMKLIDLLRSLEEYASVTQSH
jgi:predicted transcriptional regulator of viral defense system